VAAARRFFADVMLGRLARVLRFLGLDTTYGTCGERPALLEEAILSGRIILTRDRRLKAYGCRRVLVESDHWTEQLVQVAGEIGIAPDDLAAFSRCSRCNDVLAPVQKRDEVRDLVPSYTYATKERFTRCPRCKRVYWSGSHVERMNRRLRQLLGAGAIETSASGPAPARPPGALRADRPLARPK
jgi:uncharacterized protein with PIN domain